MKSWVEALKATQRECQLLV